jgi:multidrug efflux system membrane fusion protein
LPQQQLPTLTKAVAAGALTAQALTTDSQTELDTGKLQVIDNQVDQQTGTIRLTSDFPNDKRQLWPGQFVNVRLLVDTLKNVVVAPTEAIQRGPDGPYVYVVGNNRTVSLRQVKITRQDEKQAVIAEGVAAGDRIVTSGFGRLKDGATVSVGDGHVSPPAANGADAEAKQHSPAGKLKKASAQDEQAAETPDGAPLITGSNASESKPAGDAVDAMATDTRASGRRHHRQRENGASP